MHMKQFFLALILWMIKKEKMHGYEIIKRLKEIHPKPNIASANRIYPIMQMLEKEKLVIKELKKEGKRERIIYAISRKGEEVIKKFKEEFNSPLLKAFAKEMME